MDSKTKARCQVGHKAMKMKLTNLLRGVTEKRGIWFEDLEGDRKVFTEGLSLSLGFFFPPSFIEKLT